MPISLNPGESQQYEPIQQNTTTVIKRRLKTTKKMVEDALIELHGAKGVTLPQIYKFILTNYNILSLSNVRVGLIKKHIIKLRESEDIVNKTGRGFTGHLKLVDKSKFIQKITANDKQPKENFNATRKVKASNAKELYPKIGTSKIEVVKRNIRKPLISTKQFAPVVPRQVTPTLLHNTNASMFDTPMVATQVHASTPFIAAGFIPRAPEVKKRTNRAKLRLDDLGTPRSSLPGKKRKLIKRSKNV